MRYERVHSVSELLRAATWYFKSQDVDGLMWLKDLANDWMQTEEERFAQVEMLDAMIEMIERIEFLD